MRITIDTEHDSYEQALATLHAAYRTQPGAARLDPRDSLGDRDLAGGWTERLLFRLIAETVPTARELVRYLAEQGDREVSYDELQQHGAEHPTHPVTHVGGTMTSLDTVRKKISPSDYRPLGRNEKDRCYRLAPDIAAGLRRAFEVADQHPELLRS